MFVTDLDTSHPSTRLVTPIVSRDARLGVRWLSGDQGINTLRMMGVAQTLITPVTLDREKARIASFIERHDQYNWMIGFEGRIVGSIWVDLGPGACPGAPAVSLMIGDPAARGNGAGRLSLHAVTQFMFRRGAGHVFARTLVSNNVSAGLLARVGFSRLGEPYVDPGDGLHWQNFILPNRPGA